MSDKASQVRSQTVISKGAGLPGASGAQSVPSAGSAARAPSQHLGVSSPGDAGAAAPETGAADLVGQIFEGKYRIDGRLGIGGMAEVFRAHHLALSRDVAVKVLHAEMMQNPDMEARFDREARSASRLDHPNCLQVTDYGSTPDGLKFMVMQLLVGHELTTLLGSQLPPKRAVELMLQVIRGIEHAHSKGVVHRDLKPENIFVTTDHEDKELLKLVDFGIAKIVGVDDEPQNVTRFGMIFGTPKYMSPEQATGVDIDARTDLYSAGILLYHMLAGHVPFEADDPVALLRMQVTVDPPPLPPSIPPELRQIVATLLAKERDARFADAAAVREALEAFVAEPAPQAQAHHVPQAQHHAAPVPSAPPGQYAPQGYPGYPPPGHQMAPGHQVPPGYPPPPGYPVAQGHAIPPGHQAAPGHQISPGYNPPSVAPGHAAPQPAHPDIRQAGHPTPPPMTPEASMSAIERGLAPPMMTPRQSPSPTRAPTGRASGALSSFISGLNLPGWLDVGRDAPFPTKGAIIVAGVIAFLMRPSVEPPYATPDVVSVVINVGVTWALIAGAFFAIWRTVTSKL